jgi:hypothetical protein
VKSSVLEDESEQAAENLRDALDAVVAAVAAWHECERRATVAHVALGQDGRDIPTQPPDFENLAREIRRAEVGVPVPAPRSDTEALAA